MSEGREGRDSRYWMTAKGKTETQKESTFSSGDSEVSGILGPGAMVHASNSHH